MPERATFHLDCEMSGNFGSLNEKIHTVQHDNDGVRVYSGLPSSAPTGVLAQIRLRKRSDFKITLSGRPDIPVKTINTATVILNASSTFPIIALMIALPQSSRISGDSYMVFANFKMRGSGVSTENSL